MKNIIPVVQYGVKVFDKSCRSTNNTDSEIIIIMAKTNITIPGCHGIISEVDLII